MNPLKALQYIAEYGPQLISLLSTIGAIGGLTNAQKRTLALGALAEAVAYVEREADRLAHPDSPATHAAAPDPS